MRRFLNKNSTQRWVTITAAAICWTAALYLTTKYAGIGLNIGTLTLTLLGVLDPPFSTRRIPAI